MLTDLAPDLLQHVLAQLTSACAVISTARTCSAFNAVAYSDGIWTALAKARFRLVREILIVESENSTPGTSVFFLSFLHRVQQRILPQTPSHELGQRTFVVTRSEPL